MKKLVAPLLILLCACSTGTSGPNTSRMSLNVEKTPAQKLEEHMVEYNHEGIFTITAPGTWTVTTGGTGMFYWIHLFDQNEPNLQVFTFIKATMFLKNQSAKEYYEYCYNMTHNDLLYGMSSEAIVIEPSVESFYQNFMEYCAFVAKWDKSYQDFYYPQISNFETIEAFYVNDIYTNYALDNKLIHASFDNTLTQEKGEGLFTAAITDGLVMYNMGVDCGYYNIYNISGISAPYGMFAEYEDILTRIIGSITYSDEFLRYLGQSQDNELKSANSINQIMQETSNIITEGWNNRQKTYDVISQKYSDATLGFERVRNIDNPDEVYKAYNGFLDSDLGSKFEAIPDNDYSKEVKGYIYK